MKLKAFGKRTHNILFHTHTVAGIVISFALFVIFFAGAFALFKGEFHRWENPDARYETPINIDLDRALRAVISDVPSFDISKRLNFVVPSEYEGDYKILGFVNEGEGGPVRKGWLINSKTYDVRLNELKERGIGEALYRLHYFGPIPVIGLYLSGLTALFFLFASVTGVLVHWKSMVDKFYAFLVEGSWKKIWKNAHTTLGLIGLPFQLVYAVTGALLGLSTLLLIPALFLMYDGDIKAVQAEVRPSVGLEFSEDSEDAKSMTINKLYQKAEQTFKEQYKINYVFLNNYGKADGHVVFRVDDGVTLTGDGVY